jgi:hypothetical protein
MNSYGRWKPPGMGDFMMSVSFPKCGGEIQPLLSDRTVASRRRGNEPRARQQGESFAMPRYLALSPANRDVSCVIVFWSCGLY